MTVPPLMWAGQGAGQTLSPAPPSIKFINILQDPPHERGKKSPKKSTRGKSNKHAYSISHKDSIDSKFFQNLL